MFPAFSSGAPFSSFASWLSEKPTASKQREKEKKRKEGGRQ